MAGWRKNDPFVYHDPKGRKAKDFRSMLALANHSMRRFPGPMEPGITPGQSATLKVRTISTTKA
jgi:hypothetical protein